MIDDTAVTPELARTTNLVLWGDPRSNVVLANILPHLPLRWDADTLTIAGRQLVEQHGLSILCRSLYNASEFITVY